MRGLTLVVLCLVMLLGVRVDPARAQKPTDLLIIANRSVRVGSVSRGELRRIFLKQRGSWKSGQNAVPVNARTGPAREAFRRKVLRMDAATESKYWQDEKIKKGTAAPPEFNNPVKAVFKIKGAVGYVLRKKLPPGLVNVIATF